MSEALLPVLIVAAALAVSVGVMAVILLRCLRVVPPESVLVVEGRRYHGRGFKIVRAKRVLVLPVIEQATVLSLAPRPVPSARRRWVNTAVTVPTGFCY